MANLEFRRVGELDCQFIISDHPPLCTVILCHGFGAPGDDLVSIGAHLLMETPELEDRVQFVFPAAPLNLGPMGLPGGRAWWPLDMDYLNRIAQQRDFSQFRRHCPPGMPEARNLLLNLIEEIQASFHQTSSQIFLGGFSQGSMLALETALHMETPPAGLAIWSGTLLNEQDWTERMPRLQSVPVIQSHGREDPILPYESAVSLKELMVAAGVQVNFIGFRGPHTIPKEAMSGFAQLLQRHLGMIE